MKYDVFISHASEDKKPLVGLLAKTLSDLGVIVWYDKYELKAGDSLSGSIDNGLASSHFGIVVLSKAFFAKAWPAYELRGLVSKELGRDKVIIPVWFGVDRQDILKYSPPLADKLAVVADGASILQVALRVLDVVRPDLMAIWRRKAMLAQLEATAPRFAIKVSHIAEAEIRHETLPRSLMLRIRANHFILKDVLPMTWQEAIDSFRRDQSPEREMVVWELIAACYIEALDHPQLQGKDKVTLLKFFLGKTCDDEDYTQAQSLNLSSNDLSALNEIYTSLQPKRFEIG